MDEIERILREQSDLFYRLEIQIPFGPKELSRLLLYWVVKWTDCL